MNITTGGPHILLFERDQQLVALLTSELQLAGYECHAARTAVEVFDAIARYPVRLVLVDLAQAAATRREFWVALDTQRRGRGVQVVTFHCTNIGGYGPSTEDVEDRSQTMLADIEVDGMLGIMNMVNAIRSRIAVANSGAMSRLSANASSTSSIGAQVTAPLPSVTAHNSSQIGTATMPASSSQPAATITASPPPPAEAPRTATPNFTDKIRAVIYPNQRSWRSPGTSTSRESNGDGGQPVAPDEQPSPTYAPPDPFASGQAKPVMDEVSLPKESGLAQLSRMLQENHPLEEITQQQQVRQAEVTPISPMPLRASPIQDLPTGRPARGQSDVSSPNMRRPNEAAHLHYTHHPSSPTLMSINTLASAPVSAPQVSSTSPQEEERQYNADPEYNAQQVPPEYPSEEENFVDAPREERNNGDDDSDRTLPGQAEDMEASVTPAPELAQNVQKAADNAVLLDIVQSLPPMSSPPPQIQVHNGRATRSLGSVLLEGHLVAQNRLDVAQRIQRMLRGVDMDYQLGEILLMFKLLTPDQLLAASLVSYGLITAAQISALGRIRQELYSIGLEYDLENLLILFRILTSEQLREVRASW